jgi:hypothetical protein
MGGGGGKYNCLAPPAIGLLKSVKSTSRRTIATMMNGFLLLALIGHLLTKLFGYIFQVTAVQNEVDQFSLVLTALTQAQGTFAIAGFTGQFATVFTGISSAPSKTVMLCGVVLIIHTWPPRVL